MELRARDEELLEGLAVVILGVLEVSDDEKPLINAVEEKYDTLRHVLLLHSLKAEHGLAWERYVNHGDREYLHLKPIP